MNENLERAAHKFKELEDYTSTHVEKLMAQGLQAMVEALAEIENRLERMEGDSSE